MLYFHATLVKTLFTTHIKRLILIKYSELSRNILVHSKKGIQTIQKTKEYRIWRKQVWKKWREWRKKLPAYLEHCIHLDKSRRDRRHVKGQAFLWFSWKLNLTCRWKNTAIHKSGDLGSARSLEAHVLWKL